MASSAMERRAGQAEMLANRIRKNIRRLAPWLAREAISCYRIYDRDIPELPLAIDWYEGRLHVSVYEGKAAMPEEAELGRIVSILAGQLEVPEESVFVKSRKRQKEGAQYQSFANRNRLFQVTENALRFTVNLSDYVDTGLFLDHRRTRKMVGDEAGGKHFLNLFAYTGAFTVYAAAGGAASTSSVDLSNTYLGWAERNLAQNRFKGDRYRFYQNDVFGFLENHRPPDTGYGLVVIDPPTMSRSKKMSFQFEIQKDHVRLLRQALSLCRKGAVVFFSTNYRKFKFRGEDLKCHKIEEVTEITVPRDFRDRKVHRCFRLVK